MRLSLQNQPQIAGLSQALRDALAALVAAIQTGWNRQHTGDGTHTDVTATSLETDDLTASGKVRLNAIVSYVNLGIIATGRLDNLTVTGLTTANVLKIQIAAAGVTLTGIDATGRRVGDLLLLINDSQVIASPMDFTITAADTNSLAANRFIGGVASGSPWNVNESKGVWLMYDTWTNAGATPLFGWRVIAPA